ncbi:MAG: LLM class flavin-dependent oxidoreductase [Gammaproteobacteria bacterium]
MSKQILLNAFDMNTPAHQSMGLWRHPRDQSHRYASMSYWQELARNLERGLFDGIFLADVTGVYDVYGGNPEAALRAATQVPTNDPFTLVPVMAAVTENLSFGVTGSVPYLHPYSFARMISSLDHLTDGRIAWNVVTGYLNSAAKGAGQQKQTEHDTRYDIAAEFLELTYKLWEGSWEDDAVRRDAANSIYTDPSKVHEIHHDGEYFELDAIHLCEPSPQRTPVIYQAGASPKGQAFAAAHAECVFVADSDRKILANFVDGICQQMKAVGRPREDIKFFALAAVVVAETDEEAQAKFKDYQSYGIYEGSLALVSGWSGLDLSLLDPDGHVEDLKSEAIQTIMTAIGARSVREWAEHLVVGGASPVIVGSPKTVADEMQAWVDETGIDGFNLAYTVMPECVTDFVDLVVPELQRRGIYKTEYAEGTAREKIFGKGPRLQAPHPAAKYRVQSGGF